MKNHQCPVCSSSSTQVFKQVQEYTYYRCFSCKVLFITPEVLSQIDRGIGLINYAESYWTEELNAARQRSWGPALARVSEVFLYARLPIDKFLDIGSGPGYILDALAHQLPSAEDIFYAQELYPPEVEFCSLNRNYLHGSILDFPFMLDAGCCIEVIEHLTPSMVRELFSDIAQKSKPNSIYIFNTGLVDYIEYEDPGYLDPHRRGHIMGWSIEALVHLVTPLGFTISPIPGKTWAFIAEYKPDHNFNDPLEYRIWKAIPKNISTLKDTKTGELMYVLGLNTARAYR